MPTPNLKTRSIHSEQSGDLKRDSAIARFCSLVVVGAISGGLAYLFIEEQLGEKRVLWAFVCALVATAFFAVRTNAGHTLTSPPPDPPRFIVRPSLTIWRRAAGWGSALLIILLVVAAPLVEDSRLFEALAYVWIALLASYFVIGHFETRI